MAIAPKNPRKRAAKKTPKVKGEVSPETAPVAPVIEVATPDEKKTKPVKKAAVVPVAIFQAAPIAEKAPAKRHRLRSQLLQKRQRAMKPLLQAMPQVRAIQRAKIVHAVVVADVVAAVVASQVRQIPMRIQALRKIPKVLKLKMMAPVLTVVVAAVVLPEMA